jgi:hypothetical protein
MTVSGAVAGTPATSGGRLSPGGETLCVSFSAWNGSRLPRISKTFPSGRRRGCRFSTR